MLILGIGGKRRERKGEDPMGYVQSIGERFRDLSIRFAASWAPGGRDAPSLFTFIRFLSFK